MKSFPPRNRSVCSATRLGLRFAAHLCGDSRMAALPNLSGKWRALYALGGAGLSAWGLFGSEANWARILLLVFGGLLIVEGLIGY